MRLKILAALAAVLGVAAYAGFRRVQTYIREDPAFCASCHKQSPEFALWSGGQHGRVACQQCHHSTAEQSVAMLGAFLEGKKPGGGGHGALEIGACATCHLSHDKEWITVGA